MVEKEVTGKSRIKEIDWVSVGKGGMVVLLGWILIIGVFDRVIMPYVTRSGHTIALPDFTGLTLAEAESLAHIRGLEVSRVDLRSDPHWNEGVVIDQLPAPGSQVKLGRGVALMVNRYAQHKIMPNLVGRSPEEAKLIMESLIPNHRPPRITYRYSELVPAGVICEQVPPSGKTIEGDVPISLVISLGAKPTRMVVPNLIGQHISQVGLSLAQYGLVMGEVSRKEDVHYPEGTVVAQNPLPGEPAEEVNAVDLTVTYEPSSPTISPEEGGYNRSGEGFGN